MFLDAVSQVLRMRGPELGHSYLQGIQRQADFLSERLVSFASLSRSRICSTHRSSCRGFGFGFLIDNADGFIENVIRKVADGIPNRFVNCCRACTSFNLFGEKLKQTVSQTLVSARYLQRQGRNSLEGVFVRARWPLNVLVYHRLVSRHFKKASVLFFLQPLSSSHLD